MRQFLAGVASYDGLLYAVGGKNYETHLPSVEVYCAQADTWTLLSDSMKEGRGFARAALIDEPPKQEYD